MYGILGAICGNGSPRLLFGVGYLSTTTAQEVILLGAIQRWFLRDVRFGYRQSAGLWHRAGRWSSGGEGGGIPFSGGGKQKGRVVCEHGLPWCRVQRGKVEISEYPTFYYSKQSSPSSWWKPPIMQRESDSATLRGLTTRTCCGPRRLPSLASNPSLVSNTQRRPLAPRSECTTENRDLFFFL